MTLNPRWIYIKSSLNDSIGIGQDIQSSLIIQTYPGESTQNHIHPSVSGDHNYGRQTASQSTMKPTRSQHRLDLDKILARVEGRPSLNATSPTRSNTFQPPQDSLIGKDEKHDGATCTIGSSPISNREMSEDFSTEAILEVYHSMDDISLDPPVEQQGMDRPSLAT
ncbi:hypothetical protein I203_105148 [Kwoniella mangroviensis CBS 8507]|uniref:uncharacterized protein n=1 Tax=Kwoniella mangroviensis CBS 8507 TaxID=1296122 RepID=UPI0030572356